MKVFLSWSGDRSKTVAAFLDEWLRDVIQTVKPWMSKKGIEAGRRWDGEIASELEAANFGIVCLTLENRDQPWIMFEAGALAKRLKDAHVVPYLIGMDPSEMGSTPLASFQAKAATEEGTRELVTALNGAFKDPPLQPHQLARAFATNWPRLDATLKGLPAAPPGVSAPDSDEMIRETLAAVRGLAAAQDEAVNLVRRLLSSRLNPAFEALDALGNSGRSRVHPADIREALDIAVARSTSTSPFAGVRFARIRDDDEDEDVEEEGSDAEDVPPVPEGAAPAPEGAAPVPEGERR